MHRLRTNERNRMPRHHRHLAPHALPTLRVVRPRPRRQLLRNDLLQDNERSLHSPRLQPQPQSCRSLLAGTLNPSMDAPRQQVGIPRTSVCRSNPRNRLHTIHNIMQMLIRDNNHRILLSQERSTVGVNHMHTLNHHNLHPRSSFLSPQQKILDSSNSSRRRRSLHQP